MWKMDIIRINGHCYFCEFKVYEIGSQFGIDGGRISKLWIKRNGLKEVVVCNYDRGWDIRPINEEAKTVFQMIIDKYN